MSNLHGQHTDDKPDYYFSGGFGDDLEPTLEAVKYWSDGQQSLTLGTYDTLEDAFEAERELVALEDSQGLESAMQQAERMALANRTLDSARTDGRLFSDGPPDTFSTLRDTEIAGIEYTYDVVSQPHGLYELQSLKIWQGESGTGIQALALGEYDRPTDAGTEQKMLQAIGEEQGLQAEMQAVERIAVENDALQADRVDPRLFTQGPPDPFITLRQQELEASNGLTFRAGVAIDTDEAASLDLVRVELDGTEYQFSAAEVMRVEPGDADYLSDAAGKFNQMLVEEGPESTVQAATTWARNHGTASDMTWRTVDGEQIGRSAIPASGMTLSDDPTQPLPAISADWDI